ncbi:MAG: NAD(P)-dependent oxidoreductase [Polyangiales bacterium]
MGLYSLRRAAMDYLPIFIDLRGRACLVVGGGPVALRKLELLLRAGAAPRVVALRVCAPLAALARRKRIAVARRAYGKRDLSGAHLVIAATDDAEVNARVASDAQARAIPVNVVDTPALCSFIMPAIVDRSPLLVAVSTTGASPVLARLTRARLEMALSPRSGKLAEFAGRHRELVKRRLTGSAARRAMWESALDGEIGELVLAGRDAEADRALVRALDEPSTKRSSAIALIAAGDGDPDRLSVAAVRALSRADVVLHERDVPGQVLALARLEADRVSVGRVGGRGGTSVRRLVALVRARVKTGKRVCVVRAADPYVHGERSGTPDERAILRRAGLAVTILRPAPRSKA